MIIFIIVCLSTAVMVVCCLRYQSGLTRIARNKRCRGMSPKTLVDLFYTLYFRNNSYAKYKRLLSVVARSISCTASPAFPNGRQPQPPSSSETLLDAELRPRVLSVRLPLRRLLMDRGRGSGDGEAGEGSVRRPRRGRKRKHLADFELSDSEVMRRIDAFDADSGDVSGRAGDFRPKRVVSSTSEIVR